MVEDAVEERLRSSGGQPHDRIRNTKVVATAGDGDEAPDVDITIGQKMLSAVTGSIFTSLLGRGARSN